MHFSFFQLVEHAARTRAFTAGTILGSGTVSGDDPARGWSCIAEARARELIEEGRARTGYLAAGDTVEMDMRDANGRDLFGRIAQRVVAAEAS
jgi:fumarylacetoacetate (FAA) hydrolase